MRQVFVPRDAAALACGAEEVVQALAAAGVEVLIADPNRDHLRGARSAGLPTYYGDILAEAAESNVEFLAYDRILAASDNDAYNTLVATDLAPDFGRESIWQVTRERDEQRRHALPAQLGGQGFGGGRTLAQLVALVAEQPAAADALTLAMAGHSDGADAVLVNTAIAVAADPVTMARAFALATQAGRLGHLAGRGSALAATQAEARARRSGNPAAARTRRASLRPAERARKTPRRPSSVLR